MRTIQRDIVAALLFSKDTKLFMAFRDTADGGVYKDTWHIPGGGIDEKETKEQAVIREVKEETGIDIAGYPLVLVDDSGHGTSEKTLRETGERVIVSMHFFVYKIQLQKKSDEIDVLLGQEFATFKWFTIPELRDVKLAPPSIALFKKMRYIP